MCMYVFSIHNSIITVLEMERAKLTQFRFLLKILCIDFTFPNDFGLFCYDPSKFYELVLVAKLARSGFAWLYIINALKAQTK